MSKELVNGAVSINIPDGFHIMSAEELQQAYLSEDTNRWGAWDRERHRMITLMWKDYPRLLMMLSDLKAVCRRNEQLSRKGYAGHDYCCDGFFSLTVGGRPAEGYRFSYRTGDTGQSAETVLIRLNKTIYSITCCGRTENQPGDHETFAEVIGTIRTAGE